MAVIIIDIIQHKKDLFTKVLEAKPAVRWAFYYLLVFIIAYIGAFGESKFIYFKF
jgi:hypothetical protein